MNNTTKYSLYSFFWFSLFPVFIILIPGNLENPDVKVNSLLWVGGLCFVFHLWATNDAKLHNVSKNAVNWFTAGWLLLPIIIVIPYLYFSRGKINGSVATLKYLFLCVIFFIGTGLILKIVEYVINF